MRLYKAHTLPDLYEDAETGAFALSSHIAGRPNSLFVHRLQQSRKHPPGSAPGRAPLLVDRIFSS